MRFWITGVLVCLALMAPFILDAARDKRACYRDLERNFFDPAIVNQAFSLHKVSQGSWFAINNELKKDSKHTPRTVKERARKLPRNPFNNPFQIEVAAQILMQVEYEVFSAVMFRYEIRSPGRIRDMFNYIRDQKMLKYPECFGATTESGV